MVYLMKQILLILVGMETAIAIKFSSFAIPLYELNAVFFGIGCFISYPNILQWESTTIIKRPLNHVEW